MTEAAFAEQMLDAEDKELLTEIYSRLEVFEQENRPYHDAAKECREIMRLNDPKQDPPGTDKKVLQLQTLKSTINNCVADQMQNMPEPRLTPESQDKELLAYDLQDICHYVLYSLNNYEYLHKRRVSNFFETGTNITQIAWDPDMNYGKGDIATIVWPVESFLWDPQAEDIQDARALMKVSWHPKSWYQEHYPDAAPYISAEDGQHNNVGLPESRIEKNSSDEARAMLIEYWYRKYNSDTKKYSINVAYAAGGALISKHENVYMHGMYPFVLDVHSDVQGSPVGEGLVTELAPMMRYINRYAHYIDTNLRMSSKGRILTRRNSGIDKMQLADWSQDIIEGDSVVQGEDWNWMQHAPFNGMISNQMLQFENDLKQDSGANQFTRGETNGGIISGKAIGYLQEAGSKIANMRTDTLNSGFKRIVEQILWLMAEFYDDDRVLMITGRGDQMREIKFDSAKFFGSKKRGKSVPPPPYMVQVEIQRRNPAQINAQNEMFLQAYTMAAQAQQYFPLSSLFQILNVEGKDRIMPVLRENEERQNLIVSLQQQIEQMGVQMEQLQKENQNMRSVSARLTSALSSMGANGQTMAQTPGAKAPTANSARIPDRIASQARETLGEPLGERAPGAF